MFLFRSDAFLAELGQCEPEIVEAARAAMAGADEDIGFARRDAVAFGVIPKPDGGAGKFVPTDAPPPRRGIGLAVKLGRLETSGPLICRPPSA